MGRAWLWVLMPMAIQLTNGCIVAPTDEELAVDVLDVQRRDGHCLAALNPGNLRCHVLSLRVANPTSEPARVDGSVWRATDSRGNAWDDAFVDDPARLAPGGQRTMHVGFTTGTNVTLVELRWGERGAAPIGAPGA